VTRPADSLGTKIRHWTVYGENPVDGFGRVQLPIPGGSRSALHRLVKDEAMDWGAVLLAVHLKVISELSSDREILTCFRNDGESKICQAVLPDGPWHQIISVARAAAATARAGAAETQLDLRPLAEPSACDEEPDKGVALRVGLRESKTEFILDVTYNRRAFRRDMAERVAGYYRIALELMATDPAAFHGQSNLLSEEELRLQRGLSPAFRKWVLPG
jgi:hypothetical protein